MSLLEVRQPGSGPPPCITSLELQRRVESRRGPLEDGLQGPGKRVRVTFVPERDGSTLQVRIVLRDDGGEFLGQRRLRADPDRCREVDDALVLVVASLFGLPRSVSAEAGDDETPQQPGESDADPHGAPTSTPMASSIPPRAGPNLPARAPRSRERWRLSLSGAGVLSTGTTSRPAGGLSAGLWGERSRWAFAIEAQALPRSQSALADGGEIRFEALWAQGLLCGATVRGERARFELCVGSRLGWLRATSRGLASDGTQLAPLLDVSLGPRLSLGGAAASTRGYVSALLAIPLLVTELQVMEQDGSRRTYHENGPGIWLAVGFCWGPSS